MAAVISALILIGGFFGYRYFSASGTRQIESIAVMPFENRNSDADTDYLSDGLAESVIFRLTQIRDLKVSPTSSVMRYKGKETDIAKIASELGVDAVMTGRLTKRGDNLNITVELVDARTNKSLWGEQYERKLSELLTTQREIVAEIVGKLQLKLSGAGEQKLTKKYTDNNEAYQAYLKGRYYWNRRTAENLKKAIEHFKIATDRDPNYALAYAGLADCYNVLNQYTGTPMSETVPQARVYAERAIAIDDRLGEPHTSLGYANELSWQWAEAEREYRRGIELSPNYATAYQWYSNFLKNLGRYDEAAVMIKRAHEIDPLSRAISSNVSRMYQWQNDHDASIENSLRTIELDPNHSGAYQYLGVSYLKLGRNAEAIDSFKKAVELSNRNGETLMYLGYGYGVTGKHPEAIAIVKESEEKYARKETNARYVAGVYAGLGEKDKAFEWLEKDFQSKGEVSNIRWALPYEALRDDPRFKDLLKRMGLPE